MKRVSTTRTVAIARLALAGTAIALACSCSSDRSQSRHAAAPPTPTAQALIDSGDPTDLPGAEHVMYIRDGVYSGGVPIGDEGFDALRAMGVRTIVAVDAATPDAERARARGMRYVHVPIEYAGVSTDEKLDLTIALRDLPRPIYVHCHHGQHRAPTAAALALVSLGEMTPAEGRAALERSGTSPNYPGLYRCVDIASPLDDVTLAAHHAELPEIATPESFAASMAEVDRAWYRLQGVRKNGWEVPANHPDLVPAALAGRMEVLLRTLSTEEVAREELTGGAVTIDAQTTLEFVQMMQESAEASGEFERALGSGDKQAMELAYTRVSASCKACHADYRNEWE